MILDLQLRREHHAPSNDVLDDLSLPGLLELKGRWHGSLNASGGGNGDTLVKNCCCLHYWELA